MISVSSSNLLVFNGKEYRCALGKNGVATYETAIEGDGATPLGIYRLQSVYYRPDKIDAPETGLPVFTILPDDGWCDDPADPNYNKKVKLPYAARHEKMWRDDDVYDLVVEIGYNDNPVLPGKGSCIFMHIARDGYQQTEGCIALACDDLLAVLKECNRNTKIEIKI